MGRVGKVRMQSPSMIPFGAMTEDGALASYDAATQGVTYENTGSELLVIAKKATPKQ